MPAKREPISEFEKGVWIAVEYLILTRGEGVYAREVCREAGIDARAAFKLTKSSGYRVREMNRFIRDELEARNGQ